MPNKIIKVRCPTCAELDIDEFLLADVRKGSNETRNMLSKAARYHFERGKPLLGERSLKGTDDIAQAIDEYNKSLSPPS